MTGVIVLNPPARGAIILATVILPPEYVLTTDSGSPLVTDSGATLIPDRGDIVTDAGAEIVSDDGRVLTTDS